MSYNVIKSFDLSGKVAAVTGGAGVLCGAMAEALAEMDVKVAILDINKEKLEERKEIITRAGGTAETYICDVLSEESLQKAYSAISESWGAPDILINGAGGNHKKGTTDNEFFEPGDLGSGEIKSFFDLDVEGFRWVFDLNFFGTFLVTKVFARGMAQKQCGTILNVSSMNAFTPLTKIPAYASAKAAVSNFTKWLAVHFAHTGIRVNAIAPGFMMTEQLRYLHIDQETGEPTPRAKKVLAHTPMGRYGEPEELLGTVVWLLSDASKFVTGNVVAIDGGFSSYTI